MDYVSDINIYEAVIHVLDNNGEEPILNEFALDLSDELYTYLLKHIQKALKDEDLKYAKYSEERNIVRELCQQYLNGHENILEVSKEVSRQMFMLMKSGGNIPSCDMIVVAFSCELGPMLGMLKMDYIKNYMHTIDFIEEKIGINIIPQYTGLPGSGQRVAKCAFVKVFKEDNKYDLLVIDKKKKSKDTEEYGTNYFIENFLGCNIIDSERDETKAFYNAAEKWTRANLGENAVKAEEVRRKVKEKLKEEDNINIAEFTQEVFHEQKEVQEDFKSFAINEGVKEEVQVDKNWVEKKLKRTRLKIDSDIDLYLTHDAYNDNERFEIKRNGDGSINILIKQVRNYIEK
ncbi:nucleoid-associated protein [Oceanirhabdus seepicola]|uniref:Nucleoid-associated protein n=1 Tax=Oceanirhabdus seepicola TaxID=2828781 RepID=A0A9J6P2U0_9CLOT|nr:nucleoid-associated protein [Oceanirhabdus seepicola]MCM1990385.1 nucleoid-associated protein [Oceanirhabdus seepicola]